MQANRIMRFAAAAALTAVTSLAFGADSRQAPPHETTGAQGMMGGMGMMGGGMMGGGTKAQGRMMGCPMMSGGMGGGHAMPALPPGNEKLQLQMHAEIMQKVGEIIAKYANQIQAR